METLVNKGEIWLILLTEKDFRYSGFLRQGGRGCPPKTTSPLRGICPPKIFEETIERTIETIAYCFEKQWSIVFCPLKFFSSRKPVIMVFKKAMIFSVKIFIFSDDFKLQWIINYKNSLEMLESLRRLPSLFVELMFFII